MVLRGATSLLGALEEVGPENYFKSKLFIIILTFEDDEIGGRESSCGGGTTTTSRGPGGVGGSREVLKVRNAG
jgi:hypothetical protein